MMNVEEILDKMGYSQQPIAVKQFGSEEDGTPYNVWNIQFLEQNLVLKQAKEQEISIYKNFFADPCTFAPRLFSTAKWQGNDYLLMEYVPGNNLMQCNQQGLVLALDALITMQSAWWDSPVPSAAFESRINRGKYLNNSLLERAYQGYLEECIQIPATLCHDDLLPFNVIISGDRAVFIDWETAGILPYPTSLARLIAHTEDSKDALFYLSDLDRSTAVDYYYENLVKGRGVAYDNYRRSLDFCLFYEYCEWVYVGNKYHEKTTERYKKYFQLALLQAEKLGY